MTKDRFDDDWTERHFYAWANRCLRYDEVDAARTLVLQVLTDNPDLIDRGWTWMQMFDYGCQNYEYTYRY